jgi:pimeloyl-ACP methyl ester carboxylesterase
MSWRGKRKLPDCFLRCGKGVKAQVPARVLIHRLKLISRVDVRGWLPKISVRCFYIQATSDRSVPPSSLFDFLELVPDLRILMIRGPHFILQAENEASMRAIQDFVALIKRPSGGAAILV